MLMQNYTGPASIIGHHLWISAPLHFCACNKRIIECEHDEQKFKQQTSKLARIFSKNYVSFLAHSSE